MVPRAAADDAARQKAWFLVVLMCSAFLPLMAPVVAADGGRAGSISVTGIPGSLEVNPGEAGEYTVRVRNTGSDPVTVQLSTSQEATEDCNGFTSSITQIPGQIDGGSYEEAAMNVSVAQTVEADAACDTTITATVTAVIGAPAAEIPEPATDVVTTTAADGSGSAVFGVDLTIDDSEQDWEGVDVLYLVEIENTGQTNQTVNLDVAEKSGSADCKPTSDFTVTLSESTVNVDQEDTETVTVTVEVSEGQSAATFCWEITGTVANDPSQEAKDTESFELIVPELKECSLALSKTSVSVNPNDDTTVEATYINDGNADWNVFASAVGSKANDWVSVDGPSSGLLPYDDGNGERSFDFVISPDDTVTAGSETVVSIVGKDGANGAIKCQKELRIIVGQSRGASISLANSLLSNIEPGSNKSTTLTITNQGNGQDNLRVASSIAPTGWAVQLETSSVSVGSKHGNEKSVTIDVTVRVPSNALATRDGVDLTFSVLPSSGGTAYDTVDLRVTVAAVHGLEINAPATDQTGRSGTEVRFPIELINEGNIKDTIGLSVISQTATPAWGTSFEDGNGMPFTEIDIEPQSTTTVYLVVNIDGEEELESSRLTVRVRNKDDPNSQDNDGDGIPDNQREEEFLAVLSDRNFSMDLRLVDTDTATTASVVLPPNGEQTIGMWVRNTGDGTDNAVFTLGGLEGIATRSMSAYGLPVDGSLEVPKGYGIWDMGNATFVLDSTGKPYIGIDETALENKRVDLGLIDGYQAKPFEVFITLTIRVNPGAETGQGGMLEVLATSESNAGDRSGLVTISLEVSIIHEVEFIEAGARQEVDIVYGGKAAVKEISILNTGNIRTEVRVFASENLRGWSVVLESDNTDCTQENSELLCMIDEGERLYVNVTIRAPYGAEMEDLYKFTVSAEPTETGVLDRQNIEFAAQGVPPEGVFGVAPNTVAIAAGTVVLLLAFLAILGRRS